MRYKLIMIIFVIVGCFPILVYALTIHVSVRDQTGVSLRGAVVSLRPLDSTQVVDHERTKMIDQIGRAFVPQVIAVATGTLIDFPNSDDMRHHVYSFSKPKRFELKLYSDQTRPSVLFDKPGLVSMGCNIHDWMRGYVYVLDEPYFSMSNESGDGWIDVAPGKYQMVARHPRQKSVGEKIITVDDRRPDYEISIYIDTKGTLPDQIEPPGNYRGYRP